MFKKNLSKILSSFTKTISQLEKLEQSNLTAVSQNQEAINRIAEESVELSQEAVRAKSVAEKLRKILE